MSHAIDTDNDNSSLAGAERIAKRIEDEWAARGWRVTTSIQSFGFYGPMRSTHFGVRTDMINGWPRHKL